MGEVRRMGETAKEQTPISLTKQLSQFVGNKIKRLGGVTEEKQNLEPEEKEKLEKDREEKLKKGEKQIKAELADLRRGAGKVPGELPELWGMLFQGFPIKLNAKSSEIEPSKAEWAAYLSLTLYALHQQGHDIIHENMQCSGVGLGTAVRKLVKDDEEVENNSVFRRFQTFATSSDIKELAHHLRGIVQILSQEKIALDYVVLSEDLYRYQFEESKDGIRLKWGRQYFSSVKNEDEEPKRSENVVAEEDKND